MICHTLIFSFGEGRTAAERDEFLTGVTDICLGSGIARQVETRAHLPLANDSYALVTRPSRGACLSAMTAGGHAVESSPLA
jgi:hypothetical protein